MLECTYEPDCTERRPTAKVALAGARKTFPETRTLHVARLWQGGRASWHTVSGPGRQGFRRRQGKRGALRYPLGTRMAWRLRPRPAGLTSTGLRVLDAAVVSTAGWQGKAGPAKTVSV